MIPLAPPFWCRHRTLARTWCAVHLVGDGAYSTRCNGKYNVTDAAQFDVSPNPPPAQRCRLCSERTSVLCEGEMGDES